MSKYNLTDIFEQYQIGSGWTRDFDYDGMLNAGLKVNTETPIETLKKLFDDFTDVNYHREAEHLSYAIDALEDDDIFDANGRLNDFHIEIEKTMRDQGMDTSSDLAAFMASKMEENEAVDLAVETSQKKAGIKEDEDPKDSEIKDIRFDIELCKKSKSANLRSEFSDIIRKGQKAIKDIYKPVNEVRVDRDVEERIEGLLNRELKRKFLFAFEDLYSDLIEEDPFHAEDVIAHLSNEMFKQISNRQAQGDRLAGLEEDTAMSGAIADEEEAGAIGTHLAEDKDKVAMKDVVIAILKDAKATNTEVQAYVDSLTNDIKLNGKEAYEDYEIDDYVEDFKNYIADKSLQEHFGRFMKDYQ